MTLKTKLLVPACLGLFVSTGALAQDTVRVLAPTWVGFAPAL